MELLVEPPMWHVWSLNWIICHSFALKVGGGEKCQKIFEPSTIQHLYIYIVFYCLEASWENDLLWGSLMNGLIATPISLDFLKNHRTSIPNSNVFERHDCDTANIILHSTMPPTISPNINSIIALHQKIAKSFANTCDSNHKSLQKISWVLSPPPHNYSARIRQNLVLAEILMGQATAKTAKKISAWGYKQKNQQQIMIMVG